MIRAIEEFEITGLETTLGFGDFVMRHPAFRSGDFDTRFVEDYFTPASLQQAGEENEALLASLLATFVQSEEKKGGAPRDQAAGISLWKRNRNKH
jgi:propionyl-CoA carboxylase alpha chain